MMFIKNVKRLFCLALTFVLIFLTACTDVENELNASKDGLSSVPSVSRGESETASKDKDLPDDSSQILDSSIQGDDSTADNDSTNPYAPTDEPFEFANGLMIIGTRCMEAFGGRYDNATLYSKYVSQHKADLGDAVNVYSMVVPTSGSIYLQDYVVDGENYYEKYGGQQVEKLEYIDELFADGTGVVSLNVYETLFKHWDEDIYFRTDWHWTQLGAYYAAQVFSEKSGLNMADLDSGYYTKDGKYNEDGTAKAFIGAFYASSGKAQVLKDNPDELFWYEFNHDYTVDYYDRETGKTLKTTRNTCYPHINDAAVSSWYMSFLDADNNICKINTGTDNGRVAVVFKDSFGNCFAPMLMSMFETVYTVDFRYFTENSVEFCQSVGATDVLFVLSSFSAMGNNCLNIGKMRLR